MSTVYIGSKTKINLNITGIPEKQFSDPSVTAKATFYTSGKLSGNKVEIEKASMKKTDDDNYYCVVDTTELPAGTLNCMVDITAGDVHEILVANTGVTLKTVS